MEPTPPQGLAEFLSSNGSLITGALGAATSAYFTELKTWRERVASFFGGLGAVYALADLVNEYLKISDKASAYLVGFFALNICAACLKSVRRFGDDADFWTLLKEYIMNKIGKPTGKG